MSVERDTSEMDEPSHQELVMLVLAGLKRPLDVAEEQRLDNLIGATPQGRIIADAVVDRWLMTGMLDRSTLADEADNLHETEPTLPYDRHRTIPRRSLLRLAGVAVAACVAGTVGYEGWRTQWQGAERDERIFAANGSRPSHARLPDGSSVTLSRHARIASAMSTDERRIRHLAGEAFYNVAKDSTRPFVVEAGGYSLTALGTSFNVDPVGDGVLVDLIEGRLRIERLDGGRALILGAGQRFVAGVEVRVLPVDPDAAAWADGRLVFNDVSLTEVARRLVNHSDVALVLDDAAVADLRFSGVMEVDAPQSWRLGLQAVLPVRVTPRRDGLHVEMIR